LRSEATFRFLRLSPTKDARGHFARVPEDQWPGPWPAAVLENKGATRPGCGEAGGRQGRTDRLSWAGIGVVDRKALRV